MASALLEREQGSALPIRNGAFVAVVGPSGAGKDTLIAHARDALAGEPQVEFVRRVITRRSTSGMSPSPMFHVARCRRCANATPTSPWSR